MQLYRRFYRRRVPPEQLSELREDLWNESGLNLDFLALTLSSCVIASLGLLMNSAAVIIGAMIIAPLMMPLRALALGALDGDQEMISRSLRTLGLGTLLAILISALVGGIFQVPAASFGTEINARIQPNLADLLVAIAAGGISGFAKIRRKISDALAGTAISVALMPPLCVVGISLSQGYYQASGGAFLLYATNFLGITLACLLIFAGWGYYVNFRKVRRAVFHFTIMTGILVIPLFLSLYRLVQQERLEAFIRERLENETITLGQQTELVDLKIFWSSAPWSNQAPVILLTVQAYEPVTPRQVKLVEEFLKNRLNQSFRLIFRVNKVELVTADKITPKVPSIDLPFMDSITTPLPPQPPQNP